MTDRTLLRFRSELNSFFLLIILNLVFGALAMAFGVQFIVTSVLVLTGGKSLSVPTVIGGSISMMCIGLGIAWVIYSTEIFGGIEGIRTEFGDRRKQVSNETLTSGIIRMVAHYRKNRKIIRTMIFVSTLGGFCFLALGIINSLEFFSLTLSSGRFTLNNYLLIPSAILTLAMAMVSLFSSYYFMKFSRVWDLRLQETDRSEDLLKKSMGSTRNDRQALPL